MDNFHRLITAEVEVAPRDDFKNLLNMNQREYLEITSTVKWEKLITISMISVDWRCSSCKPREIVQDPPTRQSFESSSLRLPSRCLSQPRQCDNIQPNSTFSREKFRRVKLSSKQRYNFTSHSWLCSHTFSLLLLQSRFKRLQVHWVASIVSSYTLIIDMVSRWNSQTL